MVEMSIYGVSFDLVGKQPIVLLKTAEGNRYLPIWIGHSEAAAILMKLQGADAPRPLTHDLLVNILGELDVEVSRVTVTELRGNTFHASITVVQNGTELEVDSRSSDAIAIAVRAHAPIFVADDVIEESAIEMEGDEVNEEEIVDEFRSFLDRVSAEDFAEAEVELDLELEDEDVEAETEDED
jgi:bifunctional DNase/RNase